MPTNKSEALAEFNETNWVAPQRRIVAFAAGMPARELHLMRQFVDA